MVKKTSWIFCALFGIAAAFAAALHWDGHRSLLLVFVLQAPRTKRVIPSAIPAALEPHAVHVITSSSRPHADWRKPK